METPSEAASPRIESLRLLGGALCLDFANTLDPRHGEHRQEYLRSYGDLLNWGRHAGILTGDEADRLRSAAELGPGVPSRILRRAIDLREAIWRVFAAIAAGDRPHALDLELVSDAYRTAMAHVDIAVTGNGFGWQWTGSGLDRVLWPVARSAGELLTAGDLERVKECPGAEDCGWLFLDASKNNSRRWCSMDGCGSRVKMRRQYARRRESRIVDVS